ncbi:MAG: hypothetical protein MK291_07790, partial [Planctomycetes bacterium]|nr:hypothetical protein [Planctomycetota bacterium]
MLRASLLPRAATLLTLCLAPSCGSGEAPLQPPSSFERLELEATDGALVAPEVTLLASLGDLGGVTDCADWSLDGPNFEFLSPEEGRVLKVGRARAAYIAIPAQHSFEGACEVTVRLISRVLPSELTSRLISGGEVIGRASAQVAPWKNQQEVRLRFDAA